ncbi:hypothetical protein GCM10009595_01320 [Falsarthrobacter nasiphocae]
MLVSGDAQLIELAATVCAAASLELVVLRARSEWGAAEAPAAWWSDPASAGSSSRGDAACVVCLQGTEPEAWAAAEAAGGLPVAVLPQAGPWLVRRLLHGGDTAAKGRLVGVVSASGGCGSTSLTALLSAAAARTGRKTVAVDGDPLGAGLDDALACEDAPGVRWEDLEGIKGIVSPAELAAGLPEKDGFAALLRRNPSGPLPGRKARESVVDAVRAVFDLALVDIGRGVVAGPGLAEECDDFLLLVSPSKRGVEGARALLALLGVDRCRCVVGPRRHGVRPPNPRLVADLVGAPYAGRFAYDRRLAAAEDAGVLAALAGTRSVKRLLAAVV